MAIRISAGAAPSRRSFLSSAGAAAAATVIDGVAKPYLSFAADRPRITHGLQSGDVSMDSGMVWARADRPARMLVDVATTESFKHIRHSTYVDVLPESDFTGKLLLEDLPAGQDIFYRIRFQNLASPRSSASRRSGASAPRQRTARTCPSSGRATPPAAASASISRAAACAPTRPCWRTAPTSSSTPATSSMPTARSAASTSCRTARRGGTWSARRSRKSPRRSLSSAATTNTISPTRTCERSTPRCRSSRNGTITRSPTTGSPAAISATATAIVRRACSI